ncbi:MAG: histidine phosphatase family protein [Deltaproteobacteria bacterium]|nr:histidine phosphatase family protein [Deltaproteobacteria bacterium]
MRQAESLRDRLKDIPVAAIYCSDLSRSLETAGIIAEFHRIRPQARPGLREIHLGEWDGLLFDEVRLRYPDEYEQRGRDFLHFKPPGGESFLDCANRSYPALLEAVRATCGHIVIVGHAGVNRLWLCRIMGKPMDTFFDIAQDYGCLNLITEHNNTFHLDILNQTSRPGSR